MGSVCSDNQKRANGIPTNKRFCRSYTEIFDTSCTVSYYTTENQNCFQLKKKNTLRKVTSYSQPSRVEYYDYKGELKTRYVENKTMSLQTVTVTELEVTRPGSEEQIGFRNNENRAGRTTDRSNLDRKLGRSPTSIRTMRGKDSRCISKRSREKKPATCMTSRSPISPQRGTTKNYGVETAQVELPSNESTFSLGYVANIKLSEIPALDKCRSLPVPGEPTAPVVNVHDSISSDHMSSPFSALENDKHRQKKRSFISDNKTYVSEHTILKRLNEKSRTFQLNEVRLEDSKCERT